MTREKCTVHLPDYSEARPVAEIVQTASQYESRIFLISGDRKINAKSIMGVMMLAAARGSTVTVETIGEDADEALQSILALIADKFGEGE